MSADTTRDYKTEVVVFSTVFLICSLCSLSTRDLTFYSDTTALLLVVLCASTAALVSALMPSRLVSRYNNTVDLVWYPIGVAGFFLAASLSQIDAAKIEMADNRIASDTAIYRSTDNLNRAIDACSHVDSLVGKSLSIEVTVNKEAVSVEFSELASKACKFFSTFLSEYESSLFRSLGEFQNLHAATNACKLFPRPQVEEFSENGRILVDGSFSPITSHRFIVVENVAGESTIERPDVTSLVGPAIEECFFIHEAYSYLAVVSTLEAKTTGNDIARFPRRIWYLVFCIAAGMKLAKSVLVAQGRTS